MTVTDLRDIRDTARDTDLSDADARALALEAYRESGGTLSGAELGRRYGMSDRWGRKVIAATRTNGTAVTVPPKVNGTPRPPVERKPAARPARKPAGTGRPPGPVMAVQIAAVALVAGVAVYVSYCHIRHLALYAGTPDGMAYVLPLGIDGMVVAATVTLLGGRRHGRRQPAAWAGIVLGGTASVAMNVLAVAPELVPLRAVQITLAAYSPLALALTLHLTAPMLAWMWRDR